LPPVAANAMLVPVEDIRSSFTLRRQIADLDYQEVVNYSFVDEAWEKDFAENDAPIRLLNPIASQMSVMRSTLLGSLVANTRYNLNRKISRIRVFEMASVFVRNSNTSDGPLTLAGYDQPKHLAGLAYGPVAEEQWGQATRNVDFFDVKADLEALYAPKVLRFIKTNHPALHPGRSARIECDGQDVGMIGELHPRLQQKYDLPLSPVVFEVTLASLQSLSLPKYHEISKFQMAFRDIALVVKQSTSVQNLLDTFFEVKAANDACNIVQAIVLFDEYRGKGLETDEKSLAFRISLQDTHSTLQDEKVDAATTALIEAAKSNFGARLR
jgi:phenylalanyl-tRNA synthetase beta chain